MIDVAKEDLLGVAEVAAWLKVHRRTVEGWFSAGLERVNIGGRVFTSRQAIQRFSRDSCAPPEESRRLRKQRGRPRQTNAELVEEIRRM